MSLAQLLLSRPVASRARVVRVPGFFSEADIAAVLAVRDRHHQLYGAPQLARRGWATTYLSAGGLFRAHAPELVARLSALPRRVRPKMASPDPRRAKERSARELPKLTKSTTERLLPRRAYWRRLRPSHVTRFFEGGRVSQTLDGVSKALVDST